MPRLDLENNNNVRSKGGYCPFPYKGDKFNQSFFPNTRKMWNSLPKTIQLKILKNLKLISKKKSNPKNINILLEALN